MSTAQKLTVNMAFAVAGRIAGALIGLATTALVTRHLGPDLFGIYRTALAWAILSCTVANLGLSIVCLREISHPGSDISRIIGTALALRLTIGILGVAIAAGVFLLVPMPHGIEPRQLGLATAIAGIGCVATLGNELVTTIFQRSLAQARATTAELAGGFTTLLLSALCVWAGGGLTAIVAAASIGLIVTFLVAAALAEKLAPVRLRFDPALARTLVLIGLPVFMSEIVGMITLRVDTVSLALLSVPSQVAYYGVASKLREVATKIPYMFGAFLLPLLVRAVSDRESFNTRLSEALVATWLFAVGMMLVMGCFADVLVLVAAGKQFLAAVPAVQVTGVALAVSCVIAILYSAAIAREQIGAALRAHVIGAIISLTGFALLIRPFGAAGTAAAVAAGEFFFMLRLLWLASPQLSRLPWARLAGITIAGGATAIVVMAARERGLSVYLALPFAGVAYPGLLLVTGLVKLEQVIGLLRRPSTVEEDRTGSV
jgi:O-antigen/teichoic acid export membrane protein